MYILYILYIIYLIYLIYSCGWGAWVHGCTGVWMMDGVDERVDGWDEGLEGLEGHFFSKAPMAIVDRTMHMTPDAPEALAHWTLEGHEGLL